MPKDGYNQYDVIEILDPVLKQGFAQLPRAVLKAKGLTRNAKCLYALLLDYAWQEGSCFPGHMRLAEDLDISRRTVIYDLNELREYGLIDWKQRGMNKTNIYYILPLAKNTRLKQEKIKSVRDVQNFAQPEVQNFATPEVQDPAPLIDSDYYTQNELNPDIYISKEENMSIGIRQSLPENAPSSTSKRAGVGEETPRPSKGLTSISDALAGAQDRFSKPGRGRPPKATPTIEHYMTTFSKEFHDAEHIKSNITQAARLMKESGLSESDFLSVMFEAKAITKDYSANITKTVDEYGTKNRAPYFFMVLKDLLGLKPEEDQPEFIRRQAHLA